MQPDVNVTGTHLDSESTKEIVITIIKTVADPFLVTALVVAFMMFILLLKKEKSHQDSMRAIFAELHAIAVLLTEQSTTIKLLVEWVRKDAERRKKEDV